MNISNRGFTFVEAIMVTVIAVVVMLAVQNIFSHAVKSSLKGQDNLDSIRAASRILSELRKDLLEFKTIATEVGTVEIPSGVDEKKKSYCSLDGVVGVLFLRSLNGQRRRFR